jgi:hypothetical protein
MSYSSPIDDIDNEDLNDWLHELGFPNANVETLSSDDWDRLAEIYNETEDGAETAENYTEIADILGIPTAIGNDMTGSIVYDATPLISTQAVQAEPAPLGYYATDAYGMPTAAYVPQQYVQEEEGDEEDEEEDDGEDEDDDDGEDGDYVNPIGY